MKNIFKFIALLCIAVPFTHAADNSATDNSEQDFAFEISKPQRCTSSPDHYEQITIELQQIAPRKRDIGRSILHYYATRSDRTHVCELFNMSIFDDADKGRGFGTLLFQQSINVAQHWKKQTAGTLLRPTIEWQAEPLAKNLTKETRQQRLKTLIAWYEKRGGVVIKNKTHPKTFSGYEVWMRYQYPDEQKR